MPKNCPVCGRPADSLRGATVGDVYYSARCEPCMYEVKRTPGINPLYQQHDRAAQRDRHNLDILQPWDGNKPNREFAQRYKSKAQQYFTKEELKDV